MNTLLHYISLCCICFVTTSFYAQGKYNATGLVVTMNDLKNTIYAKDSTANALHIVQKGYSKVDHEKNYHLMTKVSVKTKIFNAKGYEHATVKIYTYKSKTLKEKVTNLEAYTHNLSNGKIIKTPLNPTDVYTASYNKYWNVTKFTFPNVKPGAVLTYTFVKDSPFWTYTSGWRFQHEIPTLYSEYIVDIPAPHEYNIKLVGDLKLDVNESAKKTGCVQFVNGASWDCSYRKFAMSAIPALPKQKYLNSYQNYASAMSFSLKKYTNQYHEVTRYAENWKNVEKKIQHHSVWGEQLRKISTAKNALPKTLQQIAPTLDNAKKIFHHIQSSYTWNEDPIYNIIDLSLKKIIKEKTGNILEINTLLHNSLKANGYIVHPVLIATREQGLPSTLFPDLDPYSHMVVQLTLEDKKYLLDASHKLLPFGAIPFTTLNQYGRLLDFKNGSSWIDLKPGFRSFHYFKDQLQLTTDHELIGTQELAFGGYYGIQKRKLIQTKSASTYGQEIINNSDNVTLSEVSFTSVEKLSKPLIQKQNVQKEVDEVDHLMFINPFTTLFYSENPFKQNTRYYPIDFGHKDSFTYMVSIEIPETYTFQDIPKDALYELPNATGQIKFSTAIQGKTLQLRFHAKLKEAIYPIAYYEALKAFYNRLVDINTNTLITVKKL